MAVSVRLLEDCVAVFIALVRCSSYVRMYVGGSQVERKRKHRQLSDGLRVIKVWSFGVGGAAAEAVCGRCCVARVGSIYIGMCVYNRGIGGLQSSLGFGSAIGIREWGSSTQVTIPVMYNLCLGVYWSERECEVA